MIAKYSGAEVYWLVIYLFNNYTTPQIDVDFIATNQHISTLPLFYVTDQQKLYILFEEQTSIHPIPNLVLYVNNNLTDKILLHDKMAMLNFFTNNEIIQNNQIFDFTRKKSPTKEIEDVLVAIPNSYLLTNSTQIKFLDKYSKYSDMEVIFLTNG
nr:hypothetical protein [Abalone asfa-like virus]